MSDAEKVFHLMRRPAQLTTLMSEADRRTPKWGLHYADWYAGYLNREGYIDQPQRERLLDAQGTADE